MPKRNPKKKYGGRFLLLPCVVMDSSDYQGLSFSARALLLEIFYQFNGRNNGDLEATFRRMNKRGFGSKGTLNRALRELESAGMIIKTREGQFSNPGGACCLYAVTWLAIDECNGKLDISATRRPPRSFSIEAKKPCIKAVPSGHQNSTDTNTYTAQNDANSATTDTKLILIKSNAQY